MISAPSFEADFRMFDQLHGRYLQQPKFRFDMYAFLVALADQNADLSSSVSLRDLQKICKPAGQYVRP